MNKAKELNYIALGMNCHFQDGPDKPRIFMFRNSWSGFYPGFFTDQKEPTFQSALEWLLRYAEFEYKFPRNTSSIFGMPSVDGVLLGQPVEEVVDPKGESHVLEQRCRLKKSITIDTCLRYQYAGIIMRDNVPVHVHVIFLTDSLTVNNVVSNGRYLRTDVVYGSALHEKDPQKFEDHMCNHLWDFIQNKLHPRTWKAT